jgi:1-deoxy-D-xylulose 5-phosphate reductoisomerase
MITAQPDFETFTFVELKTFQTISKDYFKVVFRPANESEWDKFFNQKTQNLTKAIAVMLATGKCSNQIFDALSIKT